jgi:hypothetical protein
MKQVIPEKQSLHQRLLDQWRAAIADGDFEKAVRLDNFHYNNLVKLNEDVGYWDKWQLDTLELRHKLSALFSTISPSRIAPPHPEKKLAIVFHNFSGLAHEAQLARNLSYLRKNGYRLDFDIVYLFGDVPGSRQKAQNIYGVKPEAIHFLLASSYENAGQKLDLLVQRQNYQSILYPSTFWMAYWMSLFVSHGNQKFLQMKYYPMHAGRICSWAGGQRDEASYYEIRGCKFEQLPILDLKLSGEIIDDHVPSKFSSKISLGSISRPEKIAKKTVIIKADFADFSVK